MSQFWLLKSEPDEFSIHMLQQRGKEPWTGVRNYLARNYLRQMQPGDQFFFYHSSCPEPGIAGIGQVLQAAVDDVSQSDPASDYFDSKASLEKPRWSSVLVGFQAIAEPLISLNALRNSAAKLQDFTLLARGNRLSVLPVTDGQWEVIYQMTNWIHSAAARKARPKANAVKSAP